MNIETRTNSRRFRSFGDVDRCTLAYKKSNPHRPGYSHILADCSQPDKMKASANKKRQIESERHMRAGGEKSLRWSWFKKHAKTPPSMLKMLLRRSACVSPPRAIARLLFFIVSRFTTSRMQISIYFPSSPPQYTNTHIASPPVACDRIYENVQCNNRCRRVTVEFQHKTSNSLKCTARRCHSCSYR